MNLAHLLLRQARLDGPGTARSARTAVFHGTQPWATHTEWARRAAGTSILTSLGGPH